MANNKRQRETRQKMGERKRCSASKKRRLEGTTTNISIARAPGISGEGGPSAGISAPIDSPAVIPPELDLPGPSGTSEGGPTFGITEEAR